MLVKELELIIHSVARVDVWLMPRRVNFSNLDGTWKQGVGVPVGFIAKYLVGLPVV